ncbi:MAG: DUF1673 family protein [Candidatus Methanoperedens sp.]|nr:DUF1673 family protein [Candidatus Methanoperedens sp.]
MTVNVRESIQKIMGWCPNANAFATKQVMVALPIDEEFAPGEKGKGIQNYSKMGWANVYRNYVLLLTLVGVTGFAASLFVIEYMFEGFHTDIIITGILIGIIIAVFTQVESWKELNKINQPEISPTRKVYLKSFALNAILMAAVLFFSFTLGKESPVEFMIFVFFPSIWINYPQVVYWERKNRKTIYLVEEKLLRWRPVALSNRV